MQTVTNELLDLAKEYKTKFEIISEDEWNIQESEGKWTKKEILGHLIDSVSNNHQRIVRVQMENSLQFVYDQNKWVKLQNYKLEPTEILIGLWYFYNLHLANIIQNLSEQDFKREVDVKKEKPVSLEWLIKDYIRHLKHHLLQIV